MRTLTACILAMLLSITARAESEVVTFPVTDFTGESVELQAVLNTPKGDGPFPAVVLLHGCDGLSPDATWTADHPFLDWGYDERPFLEWGYATLWVDSFGPRGLDNACSPQDYNKVGPAVRTLDAYAGRAFLAALSYVDSERIGVVGWSHGGWSVLKAVTNDSLHAPPREDTFQAAVAFYPWCLKALPQLNAPLLILIGDADDWAPAERCERMVKTDDSAFDYQLVIYPGATHAFEWEGVPDEYLGHVLRYDPDAASDAFRRIKGFLEAYLQ